MAVRGADRAHEGWLVDGIAVTLDSDWGKRGSETPQTRTLVLV
jgi:hypothetical protein